MLDLFVFPQIHRSLTWTTGALTCVRDHSCSCVYTRGLGHTTSHRQRPSTAWLCSWRDSNSGHAWTMNWSPIYILPTEPPRHPKGQLIARRNSCCRERVNPLLPKHSHKRAMPSSVFPTLVFNSNFHSYQIIIRTQNCVSSELVKQVLTLDSHKAIIDYVRVWGTESLDTLYVEKELKTRYKASEQSGVCGKSRSHPINAGPPGERVISS